MPPAAAAHVPLRRPVAAAAPGPCPPPPDPKRLCLVPTQPVQPMELPAVWQGDWETADGDTYSLDPVGSGALWFRQVFADRGMLEGRVRRVEARDSAPDGFQPPGKWVADLSGGRGRLFLRTARGSIETLYQPPRSAPHPGPPRAEEREHRAVARRRTPVARVNDRVAVGVNEAAELSAAEADAGRHRRALQAAAAEALRPGAKGRCAYIEDPTDWGQDGQEAEALAAAAEAADRRLSATRSETAENLKRMHRRAGCGWHRDKLRLLGQAGVVLEVEGALTRVRFDSGAVAALPLALLLPVRAAALHAAGRPPPPRMLSAEEIGEVLLSSAVALLSLFSKQLTPSRVVPALKPGLPDWFKFPPLPAAEAQSPRTRPALRRRPSVRRTTSWHPAALGGGHVAKGLAGPSAPDVRSWDALIVPEEGIGGVHWGHCQSGVHVYNGLTGADAVIHIRADRDAAGKSAFEPSDSVEACEGGWSLRLTSGATACLGKGKAESLQLTARTERPLQARLAAEAAEQEASVMQQLQQLKELLQAHPTDGDTITVQEEVSCCAGAGRQWMDASFPPLPASLGGCGEYPWQLPSMYLAREACDGGDVVADIFVAGDPEPADVRQGRLGDCFLIASIGCVAEKPSAVRRLFTSVSGDGGDADQGRAAGCYTLRLCLDGLWRSVHVDAWVPVAGAQPAFCQPARDPSELWPVLVEKAFAKWHGSYAGINGGSAELALHDLTGCPTTRLDLSRPTLFDDILKLQSLGCLLYVGTAAKADCDPDEYRTAGLCAEHGYTVLHAVRRQGVQLLCLRNPHGGNRVWSGPWSPTSSLWSTHAEVATACGYKANATPDGSFWMPWSSVKQWFTSGVACLKMKGWRAARAVADLTEGLPGYLLFISGPPEGVSVEVVLGLHQSPPDRQLDCKSLAPLRLVVYAQDGSGVWAKTAASAGGHLLKSRHVWLHAQLPPSGLLVCWHGERAAGPVAAVLSVHASAKVEARVCSAASAEAVAFGGEAASAAAADAIGSTDGPTALVQINRFADPAPLTEFEVTEAVSID
eukprot:TRINITY_DN26451_c0_g1_i2.p1 TRINITY_DN26451_c0_g1~~TRINITY_DN26451_c0_g1_i2.p1  ORF type:complete len:1043 (+),score=352.41 TRINITY_DN26451_c0_g1_i2:237-3365(+)